MVRKLLLQFLLLALPFIAYFVYVKLAGRVSKGESAWAGAPWFWLICGGLTLSIVGAVLLTFSSGSPPGSRYEPAVVEDGKIVPGRLQ